MSQARPLDPVALAHVVHRLHRAAAAPWLHAEVARRMAARLPVIRLQPDCIVDWGAFIGAGGAVLAQAYPKAQRVAVEAHPVRLAAAAAPAAGWWRRARWRGPAVTTLAPADVPAGRAQLVWSNMGLHGAADPQAVMRQWQGALAVDGFLMFSTLGPGSLAGLRDLYLQRGWALPFAPFVDMHDLGDMLIEAGFADPVMDQETVRLTWASPAALVAELRQLGGNVDPRRHAGLRTPRWRQSLFDALQDGADADGRVGLDFELVYGHAFKPLPRPRLAAETALPLADMRAMVRAGRPRRGPP